MCRRDSSSLFPSRLSRAARCLPRVEYITLCCFLLHPHRTAITFLPLQLIYVLHVSACLSSPSLSSVRCQHSLPARCVLHCAAVDKLFRFWKVVEWCCAAMLMRDGAAGKVCFYTAVRDTPHSSASTHRHPIRDLWNWAMDAFWGSS